MLNDFILIICYTEVEQDFLGISNGEIGGDLMIFFFPLVSSYQSCHSNFVSSSSNQIWLQAPLILEQIFQYTVSFPYIAVKKDCSQSLA